MVKAGRYNGRDLKAERVRAGLTQEQLAELLGVSRRRISFVEGQFHVSPPFVARVLSALAEVPPDA